MITKHDTLNVDQFHENGCHTVPQKGGIGVVYGKRWNRTGPTQVDPDPALTEYFLIPVEASLFDVAFITNVNADQYHPANHCPGDQAADDWWDQRTAVDL